MAGSAVIRGQGRVALYRNTVLSVTGSTELGIFDTGLYSRFAGLR